MRLPLATGLRTRPGDHTKDARTINAYPEGGDAPMLRKRPGCDPTGFDFTTPLQGFSSIADLTTQLPYGGYEDIGDLIFYVNNDSYGLSVTQYPLFDPERTYAIGDAVRYAIGAYDETADDGIGAWVPESEMPPKSEWKTYYAYIPSTKTPPKTTGAGASFWGVFTPPFTRYYANADSHEGAIGATKQAAADSAWSSVRHGCEGVVGRTYYPGGFWISGNAMYAYQWVTVTGDCGDAFNAGQVTLGAIWEIF